MTYKIQIDDEVREATAEEAAVLDAQVAASKARDKAEADKATAKQAVLDRLGITDAEAKLLLS
jgi:hypothetical protein